MKNKNMLTVIDSVGRTIYGSLIGVTDTTVTLENPAIVVLAEGQGGKMDIRLYPLFPREVLANSNAPINVTYSKAGIGITNVTALMDQVEDLYSKVFATIPTVVDSQEETAPVEMFDGE